MKFFDTNPHSTSKRPNTPLSIKWSPEKKLPIFSLLNPLFPQDKALQSRHPAGPPPKYFRIYGTVPRTVHYLKLKVMPY